MSVVFRLLLGQNTFVGTTGQPFTVPTKRNLPNVNLQKFFMFFRYSFNILGLYFTSLSKQPAIGLFRGGAWRASGCV